MLLYRNGKFDFETEARSYLAYVDDLSSQKCYESSVAEWAYATDINTENAEAKLKISLENGKLTKEIWRNVTSTFRNWRDFKDADLYRKIKKITVLGAAALPDDEYKKVSKLRVDKIFIKNLSDMTLSHSFQVQGIGNWNDYALQYYKNLFVPIWKKLRSLFGTR